MKESPTAEEWANIFVKMWREKPWMIMGNTQFPLSNAQAFLFGVKWVASFEKNNSKLFREFLETFDRKLSKYLTGSDDGVSGYRLLLERHKGDQHKAFDEFIKILEELGQKEKVICSDKE
jgi:hypothetical protein